MVSGRAEKEILSKNEAFLRILKFSISTLRILTALARFCLFSDNLIRTLQKSSYVTSASRILLKVVVFDALIANL